jgi:murein DD-endopeptidase MepM/ murein hydrolase activator NlpD
MARGKRSGGWLVFGVVLAGLFALNDADMLPGSGHADAAPAPHHAIRYAKPVTTPPGIVSSGFGPRVGGYHYGLDIAAPLDTPIRAVAPGTIIEAGPATGFGLWMQVRHPDGTVTIYGHMNTIDRPVGDHVAAGEQIATVGARGQATGPHLHLEVWPHGDRAQRVDPKPWLASHGINY